MTSILRAIPTRFLDELTAILLVVNYSVYVFALGHAVQWVFTTTRAWMHTRSAQAAPSLGFNNGRWVTFKDSTEPLVVLTSFGTLVLVAKDPTDNISAVFRAPDLTLMNKVGFPSPPEVELPNTRRLLHYVLSRCAVMGAPCTEMDVMWGFQAVLRPLIHPDPVVREHFEREVDGFMDAIVKQTQHGIAFDAACRNVFCATGSKVMSMIAGFGKDNMYEMNDGLEWIVGESEDEYSYEGEEDE